MVKIIALVVLYCSLAETLGLTSKANEGNEMTRKKIIGQSLYPINISFRNKSEIKTFSDGKTKIIFHW